MIRVLLADDHPILRLGLKTLIAAESDMEIVGEATSGPEAVRLASTALPDIAVLDVDMPGGGGIAAVGEIRHVSPATRVLILTIYDDMVYVRTALAAGAVGYLTKATADTELLDAIRRVHQGRTYVDVSLEDTHDVTPLPPGSSRSCDSGRSAAAPLSQREEQVLRLVALGHTYREIADRIHLSVKTVEAYRARIAEKLELKSRADLVRYALEIGLLDRSNVKRQVPE